MKKKKVVKTKKMLKEYRKKKKEQAIKNAERALRTQRIYYKDKPVNGEPTDLQIDKIRDICRKRNYESTIIGLTKKQASEIIGYLLNENEAKKPRCFDKYIKR